MSQCLALERVCTGHAGRGTGRRFACDTSPSAVAQCQAHGKAIPLLYGATRIAGNLIWYGDFKATAHASSPPGGGKGGVAGGGGKGGSGGSTTYTYQTGVAIGLCEGPIAGVNTVYANKQVMTPASLISV